MGPRFTDGKFQLMIHDDHAATPIWRSVDDVLYRGSDAALRQVPDDDRYSFVGAQPGEQVYVIPQTETKGVVWPGWTTQDPGLVQKPRAGHPHPRAGSGTGAVHAVPGERELLKAAGFVGFVHARAAGYMG